MDLMTPMLAEQPANVVKKLDEEGWIGQQKLDGVRLMVHVDNGKIIAVNRSGQVIDTPSPLVEPFSEFTSGEFVFDGEFVAGVFWPFDLPIAGQAVRPNMPYEHRLAVLEQFHQRWNPGPAVQLLPTARTVNERHSLLKTLRHLKSEGMMLKRASGKYLAGKRSNDVLKLKFWESCEVIIIEKGREGKDNAAMAMIDPDHGVIEVGTISCIGKGEINVGDVVEVKYLYTVNPSNPRLYQPTILRVRTDKDASECVVSQLKFTSKRVVPQEEVIF